MPKLKTRTQKITGALEGVYGKSPMINALALSIDEDWEAWERGEKDARHREGFEYALHMRIWNWYGGGDTAWSAAKEVMEAVGNE